MMTVAEFVRKHSDELPTQNAVYYFLKRHMHELREANIIDVKTKFERTRIYVLDEEKLLGFIAKKREKLVAV